MADETADCEVRDTWFLEQDVNAWTSLSYVAAGIILFVEVGRSRLPKAVLGLALVAVAEGFGSLLFHGTGGDFSQLLHDVPLIGALGFIAGWHVGRLLNAPDRWSLIGLSVGVAASTILWAVAPGATNATVIVAVGVALAASAIAHRRKMTAVWNAPLLILTAIALLSWAAGTADSPACVADSWLQPHGLWHILTAVLLLAWVDQAYAAEMPDRAPRMFRRFTDRTLGLLAQLLVYEFHRSVNVAFADRVPKDRPVLIVANHGNGFVDPIVVSAVLGRIPRFIAKAALWKVFVARPFLWLAGVLPVYRASDGDRSSNNASVFDACHRKLAQGATVAIFPEGTTGDRGGLDRVRSGAARIALGALPAAPDLVIVPIGLAYEDRVETRSRAVVMFGEPIIVADHASAQHSPDGDPDRDDVRELTATITASLEDVSPSFASVDERELLRAAANTERAAEDGKHIPSFGEIEVVARRLAAAPASARARVVEAYERYATRLQLVGISDSQLSSNRVPLSRIAMSALALVFAGSLLMTVTLINLPAAFIVVIATALVRSTATKGTVRLLVGLVAGLATWIIAGIVIADGWWAVAVALAVALGGVAALFIWPPLIHQAVILIGRIRLRDRVGLLPPVLEARERVVAEVRSAAD
ncbi:MAG: 1-acyl-sn-glycerol-3-phosphate acyltransferase [Actinobacteria bacterium]|nr:1-acyl-sn-glycerol-3-phosphate acyltransferase [Actinomycetota bacterium]